MFRQIFLLILGCSVLLGSDQAATDESDLAGQWYGTWIADFPVGYWASNEFPTGAVQEVFLVHVTGNQYGAILYFPELGFIDTLVPAEVVGNQILIGDPAVAFGNISVDTISGFAAIPNPAPPSFLFIDWQSQKSAVALPGNQPPTQCESLPPLFCTGSVEHCSELVQFSPAIGTGYLDYLVKDETSDDQYRSYIRRDLMLLVKYAAAKVECAAADWNYGNFAPIGLGDMSTSAGLAPTGFPGHSTHENGNHIDIAYYQRYAPDNLLRPVCRHHDGFTDALLCTSEPYALDQWRSALFMAYLSEHPLLRYLLVDQEVGLALISALDDLELFGWIDATTVEDIRFVGVSDQYLAHHDHVHVAMREIHPIAHVNLTPKTLNMKSHGKYVTGTIQFDEAYDPADIDITTVALLVDGHTMIHASPSHVEISNNDPGGPEKITIKFDRSIVADAVSPGFAQMAVIGIIGDIYFQASDTIQVLSP